MNANRWAIVVAGILIAAGAFWLSNQEEPGSNRQRNPCRKIYASCKKAGFRPGPKREDRAEFRKNCVRPILETGQFNGVTFQQEVIDKCKTALNNRRKKNKS
ncbi:MAG: hypothetical protein AB7F86_00895 [Bdellovibrionales bacterium]